MFYTLKIEYDGTGAYTTTLFDEEWNVLKETVYESDEKVQYFGLNEILGGLYYSTLSDFGFIGDFDMANSYILHGEKIVWGFDEKARIKIPTHYFLWINPEYGSVIESTYSPTVSTTNPAEEV